MSSKNNIRYITTLWNRLSPLHQTITDFFSLFSLFFFSFKAFFGSYVSQAGRYISFKLKKIKIELKEKWIQKKEKWMLNWAWNTACIKANLHHGAFHYNTVIDLLLSVKLDLRNKCLKIRFLAHVPSGASTECDISEFAN